jgi:site-specific DNA-methyltransferase (adenine-specific)
VRLPGTNWAALFSRASDEWATPQTLFDALDAEFAFDLDVAARPENAKCAQFYSPDEDGLSQVWAGTCFMNPPYSQVRAWAEKAYRESRKSGCLVVGLLFARSDTRWWHDYAMKAAEIRFIRGRVKFSRPGRESVGSPAPSAVIIWKSESEGPPKIRELETMGKAEGR